MKQNDIREYEIADIKANLKNPEIKALISHYLYIPTQKKIEIRVTEYTKNDKVKIYGYIIEQKTTGIIAIKRVSPTAAEIIGIAVFPEYRHQGIGRKMIDYLIESLGYKTITAETDDDAVGFYKSCGFSITELEQRYENIKRYRCTLENSSLWYN